MRLSEHIELALDQALRCRDDRKRAQVALDTLRRKEEKAIEHLEIWVRLHDQGKAS